MLLDFVITDRFMMEPWEGLDVEQEDLEAFLKKCNSGATLIPGPAGNVQAAMINRVREEAQSTQEFARDVAAATYDRDFKSNAWLWAERFIHFHGQLWSILCIVHVQ